MPLPEMLTNCLCVGAGGCVGAVARYILGLAIPAHQSGFPLGTFAVNVAGAFAIAFIATWFLRNAGLDGRMLLFDYLCRDALLGNARIIEAGRIRRV